MIPVDASTLASIVVDASAIVEMLLRTEAGIRVTPRIQTAAYAVHAPHLLDAEVAHVVRRYQLAGTIDAARGAEMVDILRGLGIYRHDHRPLLRRVWELRHSVGAYDALYVALAEALDAPLLTADERLASTHGHRAMVETI